MLRKTFILKLFTNLRSKERNETNAPVVWHIVGSWALPKFVLFVPILLDFFSLSVLSKNLKIKIHRTVILPIVLYRCETWSLTLREERKLRVFENMVLRKIFGPRRDEVTGE